MVQRGDWAAWAAQARLAGCSSAAPRLPRGRSMGECPHLQRCCECCPGGIVQAWRQVAQLVGGARVAAQQVGEGRLVPRPSWRVLHQPLEQRHLGVAACQKGRAAGLVGGQLLQDPEAAFEAAWGGDAPACAAAPRVRRIERSPGPTCAMAANHTTGGDELALTSLALRVTARTRLRAACSA
jgi:hypothetical protein